jgi:hypothetical protein
VAETQHQEHRDEAEKRPGKENRNGRMGSRTAALESRDRHFYSRLQPTPHKTKAQGITQTERHHLSRYYEMEPDCAHQDSRHPQTHKEED